MLSPELGPTQRLLMKCCLMVLMTFLVDFHCASLRFTELPWCGLMLRKAYMAIDIPPSTYST